MKTLIFSIVLFLLAGVAQAGVLDDAKTLLDLNRCLKKHTQTVCVLKQLLATSESEGLPQETYVAGKSRSYVLFAANAEWLRVQSASEDVDLSLMHKTGESMISVKWHEGMETGYDELAKRSLMPLAEKMDTEPELVEIDLWPFNEAGSFYLLCYSTNKKTEECMTSSAAVMPGGVIEMFAMTNDTGTLFDQSTDIILSVDVPAAAE
ncbi:MAG: hypothetical protein HKN49_03155 [Gammaproteobacteria bacterium]|nr:hypothetical protein [Gammaproteobacteria bacterium]